MCVYILYTILSLLAIDLETDRLKIESTMD